MISLTLNKILNMRKMSQERLSKLTGIDFKIIDDYCSNNTRNISLDHLDIICKVLKCTTTAIISFKDDSKLKGDGVDYQEILDKYKKPKSEINFSSKNLEEMFDDEFWNSIIEPTKEKQQKSKLTNDELKRLMDEDFWNE